MPNNPVHVCPERDIECGSNPKSWCAKCPLWKTHDFEHHPEVGCSVCGIAGLHACPGALWRSVTKEDNQRLTQQLATGPLPHVEGFRFIVDPYLPPNSMRIEPDPLPARTDINRLTHTIATTKQAGRTDDVLTLAHLEAVRARLNSPIESPAFNLTEIRAYAFNMIRDLINSKDQDGVLAKIRQIVNNCP